MLGKRAIPDTSNGSILSHLDSNLVSTEASRNEYVVLFAESRGCHIELWLDHRKDLAVKKFLFRSERDSDLAHGVKMYLYEVVDFGLKEEFFFPRKISTQLSSYEMEREIIIPGQESPEKRKYSANMEKREIIFHDVEVNPKLTDYSFHFRKTPPNYTDVLVPDKPQIQHIWLDGKVVPLTDELALARARGHGFIPGVREPRFWLMALGTAMILIALGRMAYRYFTSKK